MEDVRGHDEMGGKSQSRVRVFGASQIRFPHSLNPKNLQTVCKGKRQENRKV
jgi:hypothetical protein